MNHEHDDDLESEVNEGAAEETDSFPDTADELDDALDDEESRAPADPDEDEAFDQDQSEL
jgi:hypothetical protein